MDSYENFLMYFQIEKKTLFDWGISATIFPPIETVEREWENLKKRIFENKRVYPWLWQKCPWNLFVLRVACNCFWKYTNLERPN